MIGESYWLGQVRVTTCETTKSGLGFNGLLNSQQNHVGHNWSSIEFHQLQNRIDCRFPLPDLFFKTLLSVSLTTQQQQQQQQQQETGGASSGGWRRGSGSIVGMKGVQGTVVENLRSFDVFLPRNNMFLLVRKKTHVLL